MSVRPLRLRRSVLFVPGSNAKAMAKVRSLACDALIFDLEDAVAPDAKDAAREALRAYFHENPAIRSERIIRINSLSTRDGPEDLLTARACMPDAILIPKVDVPSDVADVADMLAEADAGEELRLWAMIETPKAILNVAAIAERGETTGSRLDCLVVGPNDLAKDLRMPGSSRTALTPMLSEVVVAARAFGLDVLDGVFNAFRDPEGLRAECDDGARMGFDGKTLIHPGQITVANEAFGMSDARIEEASAIVAAYDRPENVTAGAIALDGRLVERLHLEEARRTLALAAMQGRNEE
ncbi:HpcH/HpaI aldolase/citrate lyase family protein [Oricola cellulosilytica]|uniref:CoA ester lyase n=1 Tax=Oricola cellulosilytica TaxID=1429082 RepID=A0A4V6N6C5_9HYPH|nr:CoA ester lyase [Oricola cellulosilytica]TCD15952.1 CoA ester lyase [Oricola cellulosilytica]